MEKENKEIMAEDISAMIKDDQTTDSLWPYIMLMLFFAFPLHNNTQTREELAELKGKVSVLEKLAVRGN